MKKSDEENLLLAGSTDQVDRINSEFYGRFPYPWQPQTYHSISNLLLPIKLLNQNLGDWQHRTIPPHPTIWVAGCGTNQAVYTALRYPEATVLGSDLSGPSLELCAKTAKDLGLTNLELRQESINGVDYIDRFDYIICTGVIHHNSEPSEALWKLMRAMKRSAVLELMVYNRYHRIVSSAVQKAIRLLLSDTNYVLQCDAELHVVQSLIKHFKNKNLVYMLLQRYRDNHESALADSLLQPVEHSYTIESLIELASSCELELLSPTLNEHDRARGTFQWHIDLNDAELQVIFDALPDVRRWQVTNLLLLEESPMLWFYLQRADSGRPLRSEAEINREFLDTVFARASAVQRYYLLQPSGSYALAPKAAPFPSNLPNASVMKLYEAIDGKRRMRDIFSDLNWPTSFGSVLQARTQLATSAFPFLIAI